MPVEPSANFPFNNEVFVETPYLANLTERVMMYLKSGFPVHLSGPSGTGKTSLALNIARKLGRPVTLIHGNEDFMITDLVGGNVGYRRKKVIDNFIHNVYSVTESLQQQWLDGRITTACRNGHTLIYDEFTRSRPEVNNILLSILEERTLSLPGFGDGGEDLKVHPEFKAVFTSNPEEYAGIYKAQIALSDRLITIGLENFDIETETAITSAKSGLDAARAEKIVRLVRAFRDSCGQPVVASIRTSIKIARVVSVNGLPMGKDEPAFRQVCADVLHSLVPGPARHGQEKLAGLIGEIIAGIFN
ncbi:MoxR-like ATPase [Pelotomaculum thermopropionicum SI]|uniref:MoxR-like ATPase n=1 Tax=Pelotomaculum thermopropionicum (strain DSM 13744 / JCM 10971 / SI) TaxID=370438 RepID=A5D586_PELTS|nr:MoxR-like ATPase [Pelotomaculum thermopropionicum SI]